MAERNEELVAVTLNRQRPYRAKDSDRDAVWVGPGDAQIPRWVAEKWGAVEPLPADPSTEFTVGGDGFKIESTAIPSVPAQLPTDAVSGTVETVEVIEQPDAGDLLPGDALTATVETVEPFVMPEAEKPRNKGGRRKGA